jgi:hypothetical protein
MSIYADHIHLYIRPKKCGLIEKRWNGGWSSLRTQWEFYTKSIGTASFWTVRTIKIFALIQDSLAEYLQQKGMRSGTVPQCFPWLRGLSPENGNGS